ncbi:MAG: M48 family metalloprotease [Candidatus Sigynarchaeota archaeon]
MNRKILFTTINIAITGVAIACVLVFLDPIIRYLVPKIQFWVTIILGSFLESEFYQWVKKSKRSGTADLLFIFFMFFLVLLITDNLFTGFLGAFAMYLIIGAIELKGHQVINKVIYISTITYNVLFFASLFDYIIKLAGLPEIGLLDKAFSVSFWLILALGFVFFGRRYIVVWRFMSPQYITLAIFLLAWVFIATVGSVAKIDIFETRLIYPVLMLSNFIMYLGTGFLIDKFLGVKPIKKIDPEKAHILQVIVERVKDKIGLRGKVKVGYGEYPIINAMAYGPFFDKRICVIAPAGIHLPEDELEAIVAHELGHVKLHHPAKLLAITTADIAIRWLLNIPATYYDFAFGRKFVIPGLGDVGILGFIILNIMIFAFLYIFVRVMEANADFIVKRAGLGVQLAKALYTLESFYALGQQVGLNVMLLADEKVDEDHDMLQYIDAARVLHKQLVAPPRSIALTTLLNSHPPTFLRIANMLLPEKDEFSARGMAILPGRFLRRKYSRSFAARVAIILSELDDITRDKFMAMFSKKMDVSLSKFLERIQIHGNKVVLLSNPELVTHKADDMTTLVKIERIAYRDSITIPYVYVARQIGGDKETTMELVPDENDFVIFNNDHHYRLKKIGECTISRILPGKLKKLHVTVIDHAGTEHDVKFAELKNQITREFLMGIVSKPVFLDDKEAIDVVTCASVKPAEKMADYTITLHHDGIPDDRIEKIGDFRVTRERLFMTFHEDKKYAERYARFLEWCLASASWLHIYLKKPVNNAFFCKVTSITARESITIIDRFGKTSTIPIKELDGLLLDHESMELKAREQESVLQKIAFAIGTARHAIPWLPKW